jgi:Xaa-Pro dipeptidase
MFEIELAQSFMKENRIDAWLLYDFRGSNPVMWQVAGKKKSTTRRNFLYIPCEGDPQMLIHTIDRNLFSELDWKTVHFIGWADMKQKLRKMLKGCKKIAMEYSPMGAIPSISCVDGGTLELIHSFGVEVCSSADLLQVAASSWSEKALKSHFFACKEVADTKDKAFDYIRSKIKAREKITEVAVQNFIIKEFKRKNLETDTPIVSVNQNSSNPHYQATIYSHSEIKRGDWILIDLWARRNSVDDVFSDITWVGYVGEEVPLQYLKIFGIVKEARDLVVTRLKEAFNEHALLCGWELDMVAREYIQTKGYGKYFTHRTGHSIGPGSYLHALGVNLDNLETHDTRKICTGIGFSIEPGIYLPEFGVRSEINAYMTKNGPIVTTPLQNEVMTLF